MTGEFSADLYKYELPPELIAQTPAARREDARLLILRRENNFLEHKYFRDILDYLEPQDLLVFNDTKVLPARLLGRKETGAQCEVFLLKQLDAAHWEALVRPGRRLASGSVVRFGADFAAVILEKLSDGRRRVEFSFAGDFWEKLFRYGQTPLPPYIKTVTPAPLPNGLTVSDRLELAERYQTVYAKTPGAAAAPTAGLHFSQELLDKIAAKGTAKAFVTLHVGTGTFQPLQTADIREHRIHAEEYFCPEQTVQAVRECRARGGRVIAVGTTSARVLETAAEQILRGAETSALQGSTSLYIYPGYQFKIVDALITNFHLPRSTLLLLVSALAGREKILAAYREAIRQKYRFFSFGDAMLII
ncbi:MAG: tRNA preQ1(34) S-adenosylmethionine ribosyltransferase-isomerase QueA [Candidatus Margulisbacteria bacterium]|jgi:S-adenosylmethionine:tRNA ribosyltransferase-isomerase|nr:tRNA preQ1(34) S-adenosylmethionine ribosyltransferase-isomerase QueA [Candidatus Margulisiibacteriota bacterium]